MKKILISMLVISASATAAFADGLFTPHGNIFAETTTPFSTYFDSNVKPLKSGEATCKNYFFIVAKGNCSIQNAMRDGNITKIQSIDRKNKNIMLYQKSTIVVHGE